MVFFYLLPISTYVLGLFYAYNAVVLSKYAFFLIKLEGDIIDLNRRLGFYKYLHAWSSFTKKLPGGFILPYGAMLIFYFAISPASLIYGAFLMYFKQIKYEMFIRVLIYFLPWAIYFLYVAFMLYLIIQMFRFRRMYNQAITKVFFQYEEDFNV